MDAYPKGNLRQELEVQEQAYRKIAMDLHDAIGHSLSLAAFYLSSLASQGPPGSDNVTRAISLINTSIADLRHLCRSLSNDHISSGGLLHALHETLSQVPEKLITQLKVTGDAYELHDSVEIMILRIIQECITNVIRHSSATAVLVLLQYNVCELSLEVSDNGRGFSVADKLAAKTSSGLQNIMKRCRLLNAAADIRSGKDGTSIIIKIPRHDKG